MNKGCFKKGCIPWNTGKICPQISGKNHWNYGGKMTKKHKRILLLSRKGLIPWNKGNKGLYHHSKETREKIKKNNSRYWLNKKRSSDDIKKFIKSHLGKKASEKTKRKMSENNPRIWLGKKMPKESIEKISGKNNWNWKGGLHREKHNSDCRYVRWRKKVFKRDNWTCQKCGIKGGCGKTVYLNAHHIKSWAKYPKLRYVVKNGITYCKDCHKLFHTSFK